MRSTHGLSAKCTATGGPKKRRIGLAKSGEWPSRFAFNRANPMRVLFEESAPDLVASTVYARTQNIGAREKRGWLDLKLREGAPGRGAL